VNTDAGTSHRATPWCTWVSTETYADKQHYHWTQIVKHVSSCTDLLVRMLSRLTMRCPAVRLFERSRPLHAMKRRCTNSLSEARCAQGRTS
jgi:hypothetical protein